MELRYSIVYSRHYIKSRPVNRNRVQHIEYETLQACASISVLKLYKFHLPYLVTFVNKLVFWFFPNYLGLPVLTKYFVKMVSLCLEVGLNFVILPYLWAHFTPTIQENSH